MSWSASGAVSMDSESGEVNFDRLVYSPPLENMSDEIVAQCEFLKNVVENAVQEELLEGDYSVSMSGHSDSSVEGDRKSLSLSCNPVYSSSAE